jgi:hypothetical protein
MNWAALAAVMSGIGVLASFGLAAFVYGKLTQQVTDNKEKTSEHALTLKEHAEKLEDHGGKISRLQEWKNGVSIGAKISGAKESV